jgi:hypothetical protein
LLDRRKTDQAEALPPLHAELRRLRVSVQGLTPSCDHAPFAARVRNVAKVAVAHGFRAVARDLMDLAASIELHVAKGENPRDTIDAVLQRLESGEEQTQF